jgi:hypothetical protein
VVYRHATVSSYPYPHHNHHVRYLSSCPSEHSLPSNASVEEACLSVEWSQMASEGPRDQGRAQTVNDGASLAPLLSQCSTSKKATLSPLQSSSKTTSPHISILLLVPATRRSPSSSTPSVSFHLLFSACPRRTVAPIPCRISTPDPWHHGVEALPEVVVPRILEDLLANLKLRRLRTRRRCNSMMPSTNRANWAT